MIIVLYIITTIYCLAIVALIYGFTKVNSFYYVGLKPKTKFSIVVPFRNETENLPKLLDSFLKLTYPEDLFEVILVDDFSSEEYRVQTFKLKVSVIKNIRVSNSPKKMQFQRQCKPQKTIGLSPLMRIVWSMKTGYCLWIIIFSLTMFR